MCSLYTSSYTEPTEKQRQHLFASPLKTVHQPSSGITTIHGSTTVIYFLKGPGKADINAVPNMYRTMNSSYGKGATTVCS